LLAGELKQVEHSQSLENLYQPTNPAPFPRARFDEKIKASPPIVNNRLPMSEDPPILPAGPGFGLTFLYYFSGTALVTALLAVNTLGIGLDTGLPNLYGTAFGLAGGLLGALVNRSTTLELPISSRKTFQRELDAALAEMGYTQDTGADLEGILVYRRPFVRQLLSGRVYVLVTDKKAQISSRAVHMRGIQRRLTAQGIKG
jgi:hypothetical protein